MSNQPTASLNLIELPGGLRNEIYKQVVRSETNLKVTSNGTVILPPLAFVSKQVRNEFMAMWQRNYYVTVDEIRVRVKDCRFDPLIHALRTCCQGVRPPLLIYMALSAPRNQCLDAIESWLRYCNTVSKHRRRAEYYFDVERSPWHRGDMLQFKRMLAARSKVWDIRLPDEAWFISRTMDDYVLTGAWSQSSWN